MAVEWDDPRWQRLRLEIMQRDKFSCCCCGDDTTTLNVHHKWYDGHPWDVPVHALQTLCRPCHESLGKHPKGGVWWCKGSDANGVEDPLDVLAVVKWCPQCRNDEIVENDRAPFLYCRDCGWSSESIACPDSLEEVGFLCVADRRVDVAEVRRQEESKKAEKRVRDSARAVQREAAKLRSEYGYTDAQIWELAFPEVPTPLGVVVTACSKFESCDEGKELIKRFLNIVRYCCSSSHVDYMQMYIFMRDFIAEIVKCTAKPSPSSNPSSPATRTSS